MTSLSRATAASASRAHRMQMQHDVLRADEALRENKLGLNPRSIDALYAGVVLPAAVACGIV